jgi:heptosyltransferase-2
MNPPPLNPRRILIRGVNWLGDAVMTTPALLRLREKFPRAHVALLTPDKLADLWPHHPAVDEVISFAPAESPWTVANRIRANSPAKLGSGPRAAFELALVLPNSPRSALEVLLAGISERVGYARPWRNWLLTRTIASRPGAVKMRKRSQAEIRSVAAAGSGGPGTSVHRVLADPASRAHQIHEYLHLAAALGAKPEPLPPQLVVPTDESEAATMKFGLGAASGPILGLNPGAEYGPAKRWPVAHFIAAAREIHRQVGGVWLLFGGKGDVDLTGQIAAALQASGIPHHDLAGRTTLRELMGLLQMCRVLLTNDTGPMHVAAALGTPVVVPFGSTSPELTGPGQPGDARHQLLKSTAPCSPCFLRECPIDFRCLQGLGAEPVVAAVVEVMRR